MNKQRFPSKRKFGEGDDEIRKKQQMTKDYCRYNEVQQRMIPGEDGQVELENLFIHLQLIDILFPKPSFKSIIPSSPNDILNILTNLTIEKRAKTVLHSLLAPTCMKSEKFYSDFWEKRPLLISLAQNKVQDSEMIMMNIAKGDEDRYKARFSGFLSKKEVEKIFKYFPVKYGEDFNITKYCKSKHVVDVEKHGQLANDADIWTHFLNGYTIQLLCPQKHSDAIFTLLSTLEHEFGCMMGSNVYLTPGGYPNQGFAPHYDDVDVFILQLEGTKIWKVYEPANKGEKLPRWSSRDFTNGEMLNRKLIIDVQLGEGDLLYLPRGYIHEAKTTSGGKSSLHLTVSAMQNWSWVDLMEIIIPEAIKIVASSSESVKLRKGLPRNFFKYMGIMHENEETSKDQKQDMNTLVENVYSHFINQRKLQKCFHDQANKCIISVCKQAMDMVTSGCDQITKRFLSDRLPPSFTDNELQYIQHNAFIYPNSMVRLIRPDVARLVLEDNKAVVYHSVHNSRVYHENPLSPLEYSLDDAPALEMLVMTSEPHWIQVKDLIHEFIEDKIEIVKSLNKEGILAVFNKNVEVKCDKSVTEH